MAAETTTLLTDHGTYICAEDGGGHIGMLVETPDGPRPEGLASANREGAGAWETFTVERVDGGDIVYLRSCGDPAHDAPPSYGCAENEGQDGIFVFNRPVAGAWEALRPVKQADGRVALEIGCRPGWFLCAEPDGRLVIRQPMWEGQPSDQPGGYESFTTNLANAPAGGGLPLAGPVRILSEVFTDDTGAILPIGCHFGEAFSAWCRGRASQVRDQMAVIRDAGYDHVRVWLNLGYYPVWRGREVAFTRFQNKGGAWVEATPGYTDHRLAFNQMLAEVGLRGLFSRGDCNSLSRDAIEAHLHDERRVLSHTPQIHFGSELANEKWQNFPSGLNTDEAAAVQMMSGAFGGTGWLTQNSCPPGSGESPTEFAHMAHGWFPCQPVHGTRSFGDMETLLRHFFNYGYERYPGGYGNGPRYAMHSTEPGGPGQGVTVGNTSEVWKLNAMHAATLIGRTATVYMSSHGVFWNGPIESQPAFYDIPKLRTLFQPDAFRGTAYHGNRAESWVTSAGGMNNVNPSGYARLDSLQWGDHGVTIAHHGGSGRKVLFRVTGTCTVYNWDLSVRATFDVSSGSTQDIGGDGLLVLRRR